MSKKLLLNEVLEKFEKIHGDKYDYSLIKEYTNNRTPIPIICKKHGVFYQRPDKHFRGQGCPLCNKTYKLTNESFIEKAKSVHGDKYDYSKINYKNNDTKVCIVCPIHGEFWQSPHMHLFGQGCPKCYGNERKTTKEFIEECNKIHGDRYDYSKTVYKNAYSNIIITCPIHGDFTQVARVHLQGHGCPECNGKRKYDKEYFIKKAKEIHGDKYDYSLINTIKNNREPLPILCRKHGVFYQTIDNHLNQSQGCPNCKRSALEENVAKFLTEKNIRFEAKKHFQWLGKQHLDFYLPEHNTAIECQGEQHFIPSNFGSKIKTKEECFGKVKELDERKNKLCAENGVNLIYFTNIKIKELPENIITNYDTLLEKIEKSRGFSLDMTKEYPIFVT